jgi:hypoxia-inducible factor (prolyl hydroxylase)
MLAMYPGEGARYVRHVDNPDRNGRLLTALCYLNRGWADADGGQLRLYVGDGHSENVDIEPLFDRVRGCCTA